MSSSDGLDGYQSFESRFHGDGQGGSLETMLFESLVYQLIEKGLLTRNDALSIVQSVAEVKRGQMPEGGSAPEINAELALLHRVYKSFEAVRERGGTATADRDNVRQLRPAYHGDRPEFPRED